MQSRRFLDTSKSQITSHERSAAAFQYQIQAANRALSNPAIDGDTLQAPLYEVAKIDEAKDAALIQVLDKAITPERKTKPKRLLIVLLTGIVVGFLGMLWAFVKEALDRARNEPEQAHRLSLVRKYLLGR